MFLITNDGTRTPIGPLVRDSLVAAGLVYRDSTADTWHTYRTLPDVSRNDCEAAVQP